MGIEFEIDRNEVLRYLRTAKDFEDESIDKLIDESIEEIKKIINFRYTYKKYIISVEEDGVDIKNTTLFLAGKSIKRHLQNSEEAYLMAATLGNQVDKRIAYYEKTSITKSMIFDACATTAIEEGCDQVEEMIKKKVLKAGNTGITFRYSPGYGDLDIDIQQDFLRVLNAPRKIGLTASKYNMLLPSKSVTAVIGVLNEEDTAEENTKFKSSSESKLEPENNRVENISEENLVGNKSGEHTKKAERDENNSGKLVDNKQNKIIDNNQNRDLAFEAEQCRHCRLYKDCQLRKEGIYCGAHR